MAAYDDMALPEQVRTLINLNQFMNCRKGKAKYRLERQDRGPRRQIGQSTQPAEYKDALNKVSLPTFDGRGKTSARSWVHKLDTFLSLKPMDEDKAIQFATMHLEGVAYDWWHHGLVSQDHAMIHSYEEFVSKLTAHFDRKDIEVYYRDLAQLKQVGHVKAYINEFQKIAVMVPDMSERRVTMLFVEGLSNRLRGLVKAHKPNTLHDAIGLALDLETTSSFQPQKKNFSSWKPNKKGFNQQKNISPKINEESRNELRRKKLCFSCKEPWEPGHHCLGIGKVHLIEVMFDDEEHEEQEASVEDSDHEDQPPQVELEDTATKESPRSTIAIC